MSVALEVVAELRERAMVEERETIARMLSDAARTTDGRPRR